MIKEEFDNLYYALQTSEVTVKFTKANGEKRTMRCTLQPKYLPNQTKVEDAVRGKNEQIVTVWDLDEDFWRAFNKERVISWNVG